MILIIKIAIFINKECSVSVIEHIRGSLNKFPDFFRMGTFIESIHMKL